MEKFEKLKEDWHIEKRTKGKREHYEQSGSAFRNVSGSGRGAVSVVRSLELPPSFRGPREERGVRGETGSPGPGFDWLRWFKQDSLTSRVNMRGWPSPYAAVLCCLLADDGESDGCDRGSEAAESIYRWGHSAEMSSLWTVSNPIGQIATVSL